ncbi:ATP-binding protein [Haloechinothrix salitolerans]|uniref:ATP-binding protein n=1 Tax=Haloechinothrix salitolerans TaxID=926830 RepID=A0ABW2BYE0_9PSEU
MRYYVDKIYIDSIYMERRMSGFVGRFAELAALRKRLSRVSETATGTAVAIRGRRQVGKSRLVQEFCDSAGVPYFFFTATKGVSPVEAIASFLVELKESGLPVDPELVPESAPGGWPDAFRALANVLPQAPAIVVLDELPWLSEQDESFDGVLQTAWDRLLSRHPLLLLLLGSDIHMMERLTAYDRPFYGRADNFVLAPLNPSEVGQALDLDAADTIDAHLITGGLPGILRSWPQRTAPLEFIHQECADPAAPVFGIPEATLLAEFPTPDQARRVIEAVGSGERTHATIAASAGGTAGTVPSGSLSPLLRRLSQEKHVIAADQPLSTRPGKPTLYRVADSNLRLYLAVLRAVHDLARRGRPKQAYDLFVRRWTSWRGKAVEPLIRDALELAAASGTVPWPNAEVVGGWWNRQFNPEIDLVGADRSPVASQIYFAGSIKWLNSPFDRHDLKALLASVRHLPGFEPGESGLAIVSLSGAGADLDTADVDLIWGPAEVLSTWG